MHKGQGMCLQELGGISLLLLFSTIRLCIHETPNVYSDFYHHQLSIREVLFVY
jgi:hypothetical protein